MSDTILALRHFAYLQLSLGMAAIPIAFLLFAPQAQVRATTDGASLADSILNTALLLAWLFCLILYRVAAHHSMHYLLAGRSGFPIYLNLLYILTVVLLLVTSSYSQSFVLFFIIYTLQMVLFLSSTPFELLLHPTNDHQLRRFAARFLLRGMLSVAMFVAIPVVLTYTVDYITTGPDRTAESMHVSVAIAILVFSFVAFATVTEWVAKGTYEAGLWR